MILSTSRKWRQDESYPYVRRYKGKWGFWCCWGCNGCAGAPIGSGYDRPIDAHLARLEWLGEIPVGRVRVL